MKKIILFVSAFLALSCSSMNEEFMLTEHETAEIERFKIEQLGD